MARKGKNRDLRNQAQDEARLRYNPQLRTLASMLADSQAATRSDVTSARAQGAAMSDYIKRQTPALQGIYAQSGKDLGSLTNLISQAIGQSHGGLASGAINSELRQQAQNLAGDQSRSVGDFAQRGADAQAGAILASRLARQAGRVDQSKIQGQIAGVAGDAGTYTAARYADLVNGRRQRSVTLHGQKITADNARKSRGIQRENLKRQEMKDKGLDINGKPLPKVTKAKSGKGKGSTDQFGNTRATRIKSRDSYDRSVTLLKAKQQQSGGKLPWDQALSALIVDEKVPKPIADAAVQTVRDGFVSDKTRSTAARRFGVYGLPKAPSTKQSIQGTVKAVKGLL